MDTPHVIADAGTARRRRILLGVLLLGAGLLGHLLAAHAIGGSFVAYRDHIAGFLLLSLVSCLIIAGVGWRFWRGRHEITLGSSPSGRDRADSVEQKRHRPWMATIVLEQRTAHSSRSRIEVTRPGVPAASGLDLSPSFTEFAL